MKFILNEFSDDPNFQPDENWTPLKESSNLWAVQVQATPFAIVNVLLVILPMWLIGVSFRFDVLTTFVSLLIFIPLHEFIHALFFPKNLMSENVYFGFTSKGLAPFATYIGEMKRNTFIRV
jgi:hypothetical protein